MASSWRLFFFLMRQVSAKNIDTDFGVTSKFSSTNYQCRCLPAVEVAAQPLDERKYLYIFVKRWLKVQNILDIRVF